MAGIGFELRQLSQRDQLLAPMAAVAHAAVIAAGPWLYTIIAIFLISYITAPVVGAEVVATFRILLIYVFSLSLVATAPVIMIGTRVLADALHRRRYGEIRALYCVTLVACSAATLALSALVLLALLDVAAPVALAGIAGAQVVCLLWVALAFCGAVRDYLHITLAFATGLGAGAALAIAAAFGQLGPAAMVCGVGCGFLLIVLWLSARFLATFPEPCADLRPARVAMVARLRSSPALAVGACASAIGTWADKWIMWNGSFGERVSAGLIHAPLYDSPMFVASLTIIPALALFVTSLETSFFESYHAYFRAIEQHATLRRIAARVSAIESETRRTLISIMTIQVALCVVVLLMSPVLVQVFNLQFQQIDILRMGSVGALFHFLFIVCSTIVAFFDAVFLYAGLHVLFTLCLIASTSFFASSQMETLALGYMGTCILLGLLSLVPFLHVLRTVNFRVFVGSAVGATH